MAAACPRYNRKSDKREQGIVEYFDKVGPYAWLRLIMNRRLPGFLGGNSYIGFEVGTRRPHSINPSVSEPAAIMHVVSKKNVIPGSRSARDHWVR
jgi:hypothetical protein